MSNGTPSFTVKASRHPVRGRDYDEKTHRYTTAYLNPTKYTLTVDAFPGTEVLIPAGDQQLSPSGNPQRKPKDIERLKVPPDTVAFEFSVKQVGKRFSKSVSRPTPVTGVFNEDLPNQPWDFRVDVPGEGTYDITVKLRNRAGGGPQNTRRAVVKDFLVVSIGDSAASGQGNPDIPGTPKGFEPDLEWWEVFIPPVALFKISKAAYEKMKNVIKQEFTTAARKWDFKLDMDPEPIWLEKNAYRSLRSGPAQAARRMENVLEGRLVTFLSFARTGSDVDDGLIGPRTSGGKSIDGWIGNVGQIEEVENTIGKRRIDALLISIGVNDVGVSGTLEDLVANDFFIGGGDDDEEREKVRVRVSKRLAEMPGRLEKLETALEPLNIRHVYLTEYPTAVFDRENGQAGKGCGIFESSFDLDLEVADANLVKKASEDLNTILEQEAKKRGWIYIGGIADAFRGRGYCTDNRFFVQAEESMIIQGDTEGTVHPNDLGQKAYARQIAASVIANTLDKIDIIEELKGKIQVSSGTVAGQKAVLP